MTDGAVSDSRPPGDLYCPTCERTYSVGQHCPEDGTRLVRIKAQVDPLLGRNLDGRYTIVEKLGQGGMGAVYRGTQHSVGREVAIKVISAHLVADRDAIKRFLREAKLASRLAHPNAVSVLEFGQTDDGLLYLVMELVTGRTLDQVIKREGTLKPERVIRIGMQVCDALEGAHALQIIHRDLKPANIMLLAHGRDLVKVLDFGLAKSVAPDQASTTMTNAGALLGTPAYMPPELAVGGSSDARSDLYSLGVILYLLGSGRLPFSSESPHELIAMHGSHEPAPPMTGVGPELAAVVDRMLAKDPDKRFQSATETREALEAALLGRLTPPPSAFGGSDTNPSIGPFPATSAQYAHLNTPTPNKRSRAEIDHIVSSDTIAATPVGSAPSVQSMLHASVRPRRWLVPVIAIVVLASTGVGAWVMMSGKDAAQSHAAAPAPAPEITPTAVPTPTPPTPTPTPTPTVEVTAPAAGSAAGSDEETTAEKPAVKIETAKKKPVKPTATAKTTSKRQPTQGGNNPSSTQTPTKPAAGSGSAAPSKGLPF